MPKKFAVITALALSTVVAGAGVATAGEYDGNGNNTTVRGGSGFSSSPVVVNAPQQGVLIVNGTLVDGRCLAPWSNGAVLGGVVPPNSHYAACNTAKVDQTQNAPYAGGLLF
ncbi:hypothetical protein J7F01_38330 [Streptomyces sp. ISL-22]|uniref:hypothetical protein n=1 Tax=unclassified Streptomyces TaxID=2593676 RepID=UPI001BE5423D|nr:MULTISPECIES: hypothetical protein [unclassified Streptomyces]MBT2423736.1 hypothetical protein [Streptomyces sp. ISL-24]MBT2437889.1 hypothetical protein [Streptomyces sp. ISL-22]